MKKKKPVNKVKKKLHSDLLSLKDYSAKEICEIINLAERIKKSPGKYKDKLKRKTLFMVFSKPSLRTYLSFDIAMYKLGGHAIFYDLEQSTLGKKESIKDFGKVVGRYSDLIMARLYAHKDIEQLAEHSDVPVINGLTNDFHPCQILGDLMTIKEHIGRLKRLRIVYVGDGNNNVTHSLIVGCNNLGLKLVVSCPDSLGYRPNKHVTDSTLYTYEKDPMKAVKGADIIYTDTWMSYNVPESAMKTRVRSLKAWQVNEKLFDVSKKARFMHCLPATRGEEVTDGVIDSERSIIYDQAENRMWVEMAILLKLLRKA